MRRAVKRKNGIQGDMLGTSKETKKDLILKMEREQSEIEGKQKSASHRNKSYTGPQTRERGQL